MRNGAIPTTVIPSPRASARSHRNSIRPTRRACRSRACPMGTYMRRKSDFTDGFPVARSATLHRTWLAHCYAMVGVGRDLDVQSGSGAELYVVIGHAPRHLDRNVALVGRVLKGMELLSALPRGSAEMGFYAKSETPLPIKSIRVAADVPQPERSSLEVMRTDSAAFAALIESRRNRPEEFFKVPAGHIDLCNVPIAVREGAPPTLTRRDGRPLRCRCAASWSQCAPRSGTLSSAAARTASTR